MSNLVVNASKASTQAEKVPPPEKRMNKIPARVLGQMCGYLNNYEQNLLLKSCKAFKTAVEKFTPPYTAFQRIFPLASGKAFVTQVKTEQRENGLRPMPFACMNYDSEAQWLITGDICDQNGGRARLWDLSGSKLGGYSIPDALENTPITVDLDIQKKRALCAELGGRVRIWDTENAKVLISINPFGEDLSCVSVDMNRETILCGSHEGNIELNDHQFQDENDGHVTWLCDAPEIDRVFSCAHGWTSSTSGLKIWDRSKQTSISSLGRVSTKPEQICYDNASKRLFVTEDVRFARELDPLTGKTLKLFSQPDKEVELTALHYNPQMKWIFAGFSYKGQDPARTKLVVWCAESKNILHSFLTVRSDNFCFPISEIDFDPETHTFLTTGRGVQLWDLHSHMLIGEVSKKGDARVKWDRKNSKLIIFNKFTQDPCAGTLAVHDYSPEALKRETPESKQEKKAE